MEKHHRLGLVLAGTILATSLVAYARPDSLIMDSTDYQERTSLLARYPFTSQAKEYFNTIPFKDRHVTTNGGGYWHGDQLFPYAEVFSNQDEAELHELSHAWFDREQRQNPQFGPYLAKVAIGLGFQDEPNGFFRTLAFGDSQWNGINPSDYTEYYASIASKFMGQVDAMPEPLRPLYADEFIWSNNQTVNK